MRSTRSIVTFSNAFALSGYPNELPAGDYEVVVEEALLHGLSFEAYRRTATYLMVRGTSRHPGRTEMHPISERDLKEALSLDQGVDRNNKDSEAALSPLEDLK